MARQPKTTRAPDSTPPANSATMRSFVHWIRAAAPYVHAFRGQTFVIAFGGEVVADESFLGVVHDLNLLHSLGIKLVVAHGCRPQVEAILEAQNIPSRYSSGVRITDSEAMDCVLEAAGQVRARIEALLSLGLANSPMANARYGLMFPLANAGDPLPWRFAVATSKLVQLCRGTRTLGDGLRATLSTYLEASLKSSLELDGDDESFGEHAVAVGNLWNETEQLLRPCFGFFPPDAWVTQFEAGRGIAGHAFRFARPAAWHRSIAGEYDVIRVPTIPGTRDYEWILCLPILTSPDGTAIGVFGFAGTRDHNTETTNQLAAFAQQLAQRDPAVDTDTFDRFWYVLNASFWYGLADVARASRLDWGVLDMAEECSTAFFATDPE